MRKTALVIGALAVLAVSGLFASNMGFKLNYFLAGSGDAVPGGTSFNGTNTLSLPYNRQTGLNTAQQLFDDIGSAAVQNIQKYLPDVNGIQLYALGGTDFALSAGEGYYVRMKTGFGTNYIVVGSHDPGFARALAGTGQAVPGGTSFNGTNFFAYPYHSTAANAQQLASDIGSTNVVNVQRFNPATNGITLFSPGGASPFALTPGEAYFVRIAGGVTVNYTPSHF